MLENGANPHLTSKEAERPIDLIEKNHARLISLLLSYMNLIGDSKAAGGKTSKIVSHEPIVLSEQYQNVLNRIFKKQNRPVEAVIDEISVSTRWPAT